MADERLGELGGAWVGLVQIQEDDGDRLRPAEHIGDGIGHSQRAQALLRTMLRLLLPLLGAASAAEPKAECNWVNDTDYFGPALGALRSGPLPGAGWGRCAAACCR